MMRQVSKYVLAYVLWAVSIALGAVDALIIRQAISGMYGVALLNAAPEEMFSLRMQSNAADRFGIVILGVLLLILIVISEHLYRTGVPKDKLVRNFSLITVIELAVLLVFHTMLLIQSVSAGLSVGVTAVIEGVILVLLVLFVWLYRRSKPKSLWTT